MPRLSFDTLQQLDLPLSEVVSGRIGFAHDVFLRFPYEVREKLPRGSRDLVLLVGKKERRERMLELAEYPGRVVVVFAPGDAPVRGAYMPDRRSLPANVVAAYATNNKLQDERVTSVPLGVRTTNLRPLEFARQNYRGERSGLLYGNFTLNDDHYRPGKTGTPHIRARLVDRLRGAGWANLDISPERRPEFADLLRYYKQIVGHKFVLSPEGNGIDCYRTWESLYLGAIPIVMASPPMSEFIGLPMIFTRDYSELSESYLERRWERISRKSFEVERMLLSYYRSHFRSSVSKLDDPRFVCWQVNDSPPEKFVQRLERLSRPARAPSLLSRLRSRIRRRPAAR